MFFSTSSFAELTTASFGGVVDGGRNFDEFSVTQSGVTVNVSGWSDTKERTKNGNTFDDKIERAYDLDKNIDGWSIENKDETSGTSSWCGYSHTADNKSCTRNGVVETDYDFFLLEFSEEVSLTKATYSWAYGQSSNSDSDSIKTAAAANNQVSVVALKDYETLGINGIGNRTWKGVNKKLNIASDYAQMQYSSGYYTNFLGSNVEGTESKFWLIGALNSIFGGDKSWEGNDGMKLASVSFHKKKTVDAPEPSTLVIFALALIGLTASRKRKFS